ncbi:MAG: redoxin domain-containing protein [Anaerolineae bacterium]|nr:redoxin domain-containing protein [Anaerolineae bacterium]
MNVDNISFGLAFIVGIISFLSPCVLPLVPAYIGYLGGRLTSKVSSQVSVGAGGQAVLQPAGRNRFTIVAHGLFFVLGFTFVFVTIGLLSTAFVQQVGGRNINLVTDIIGRLGGVLIIFFGLHFMGVLPTLFNRLLSDKSTLANPLVSIVMALAGAAFFLWGFTGGLLPSIYSQLQTTAGTVTQLNWPSVIGLVLAVIYLLWLFLGGAFTNPAHFWSSIIVRLQNGFYADTRRQMTTRGEGYAGSAIMGVIFSAGWTPCIGPLYGAVLTYSANTGDVARAAPLLAAYSLGLGVPFLLTALLLDNAQGILRRLQRHMGTIKLVSGAFLVLIGFLVASGQLQSLSVYLNGQYSEFSINLEEQVVGSISGNTLGQGAPTAVPTAAGMLESISGAAAAASGPVTGTDIGDAAPNFESVTDTGEAIKLADLRGQVVVLNFWATWCAPCKVEMPEFEEAYETNSDKGFTVLAVNNSETLEQVTTFRDQLKVTFPFVMDEQGDLQRLYGVVSYPSTYILDKDGVIIYKQFGPMTAEKIDTMIAQALAS